MISTFTHHNVGPTKGTVGLREATACCGESSRAPVPLLSNMILGIVSVFPPPPSNTHTFSGSNTPREFENRWMAVKNPVKSTAWDKQNS